LSAIIVFNAIKNVCNRSLAPLGGTNDDHVVIDDERVTNVRAGER
jgi:hypothetical protein